MLLYKTLIAFTLLHLDTFFSPGIVLSLDVANVHVEDDATNVMGTEKQNIKKH